MQKAYYEAIEELRVLSTLRKTAVRINNSLGPRSPQALYLQQKVWEPTTPEALLFAFARAGLNEQDTYCSLGSGIGTDSFIAHLFNVQQTIGIELQPDLLAISQQLKKMLDRKTQKTLPTTFSLGDYFKTPLPKASFFYVYHDNSYDLRGAFNAALWPLLETGTKLLINTTKPAFLSPDKRAPLARFELDAFLQDSFTYTLSTERIYHFQLLQK